jgi:hypothetical protein
VTAAVLLAELETAGVRVSVTGDDLRCQARPGVSIAPYRERIRESKSVLIEELLQREIVAAAKVEPTDFDRQHYNALWARYHALDAGGAP